MVIAVAPAADDLRQPVSLAMPAAVEVKKPLPLLNTSVKSTPSCRSLVARNFHHLDVQDHLRHAADVDVVDHLGIVILGQRDDPVDVLRPIDDATQHDAGRVGRTVIAAPGNCDLSSSVSSACRAVMLTSTVYRLVFSSHRRTW